MELEANQPANFSDQQIVGSHPNHQSGSGTCRSKYGTNPLENQ